MGATQNGDVSGRKVVVPAVTDGSVTGTGTDYYYNIWAVPGSGDPIRQAFGTARRTASVAPT